MCGPDSPNPFSEKRISEGREIIPAESPAGTAPRFFRKAGSLETTMPVTFKVSSEPPWEIIQARGDMTAETSEELISVLSDLIRRQHGSIRFDMSNVRDIDVVSLHILVLFSQRICKEIPCAGMEIIHADDDIRNLFRMTHLDRAYRII